MPTVKITTGTNPNKCLRYIHKADSTLLDTNMTGDTPTELASEMEAAIQQHHRRRQSFYTKNVIHHAAISFDPTIPLTQEQKTEIAQRYLKEMGFNDNQYVVREHHDTSIPHLHIVACRLRLDGTTVKDSFEFYKAQEVMRGIEADYGMPILKSSWETDIRAPTVGEVRKSRDKGEPIPRVVIQQTIEAIAPTCTTIAQLQEQLQQAGITLAIASRIPQPPIPKKPSKRPSKKPKKPDAVQPESLPLVPQPESLPSVPQPESPPALLFSYGGLTFSATKLGKRYTWNGLQSHFKLQTNLDIPQSISPAAPITPLSPTSAISSTSLSPPVSPISLTSPVPPSLPQFLQFPSDLPALFLATEQWLSKLVSPELLSQTEEGARLSDLLQSTQVEAVLPTSEGQPATSVDGTEAEQPIHPSKVAIQDTETTPDGDMDDALNALTHIDALSASDHIDDALSASDHSNGVSDPIDDVFSTSTHIDEALNTSTHIDHIDEALNISAHIDGASDLIDDALYTSTHTDRESDGELDGELDGESGRKSGRKSDRAFNSKDARRVQYEEILNQIYARIRQTGMENRPIPDVQVAYMALGQRISRQQTKFILSQTATAQALYQKGGLAAVNTYLEQTLQQAERAWKAQLRRSQR